MGFGLILQGRSFSKAFRAGAVNLLALQVALLPLQAHAAATGTATTAPTTWSLPSQTGQGNAQQSAGNANSTGQMLGQAMGVLSMGLGGLYMAKGAQQLSCCSTGCTGSGTQSQVANQNVNQASQNAAKEAFKAPPAKLKLDLNLRFPDGARNECPQPRLPAGRGVFSLLTFFQAPQEAQAAGGCIDAMIALATGGLMLLQGLMSLNAANQAGRNAASAYGNADSMGSYPGVNGTSPTPGSENKTGNSNIGGSGRSGELVKIDPSLLRTGKANDIMGQFEQKFGLSRDNFANAVLNGEDPRKIFGSAPKNALSNEDMNKATNAAKAMSDADKANALAGTGLSDAQKELLARMNGAGNPENEIKMGGSSGASLSRMTASKKSDEELDELSAANPADLGVSPEVQAALAQKALNDRANGLTDMTIFQLVHAKYREKSKMIFGYDPDGTPKGVGDANGL